MWAAHCLWGDFNLIREMKDKNNENTNMNLVRLFNNFIEIGHLKEIIRSGIRYTWTNKQHNPILVGFDRIFCLTFLGTHNPSCQCMEHHKGGI